MNQKHGSFLRSAVMLFLCYVLTVPALAAEHDSYIDVPSESPWYEGVEFITEKGISNGIGENLFAPDQMLTNRQWAVMLCRAFSPDLPQDTGRSFGLGEMEYARDQGWINDTVFRNPQAIADRGGITSAVLKAADIECFHDELDPHGDPLVQHEHSVRIGKELGLIDGAAASNDQISRGEAAHILYLMLSDELDLYTPPAANEINLINRDGKKAEPYLEQVRRVPLPIRKKFAARGWKYMLDTAYLENYSRTFGQTCIGLCDYTNRCLYLSEPGPTLHEFGHFYHSTLGFPKEVETLFNDEAKKTPEVLRKYSLTNSHEYFADYFAYWIRNSGDTEALSKLQACSPKTYNYFSQLAANGWEHTPK